MDKKFRMDEKLATGVLMGVWEETKMEKKRNFFTACDNIKKTVLTGDTISCLRCKEKFQPRREVIVIECRILIEG
jgi:hypothetical protein